MATEGLILVFDTETTGEDVMSPPYTLNDYSKIVQFSYLLYNPISMEFAADPVDEILRLKDEQYPIHPQSAAVHGITDEMSMASGITIETAMDKFIDHFNLLGTTGSLVAHNGTYDINVICAELIRIINRMVPETIIETERIGEVSKSIKAKIDEAVAERDALMEEQQDLPKEEQDTVAIKESYNAVKIAKNAGKDELKAVWLGWVQSVSQKIPDDSPARKYLNFYIKMRESDADEIIPGKVTLRDTLKLSAVPCKIWGYSYKRPIQREPALNDAGEPLMDVVRNESGAVIRNPNGSPLIGQEPVMVKSKQYYKYCNSPKEPNLEEAHIALFSERPAGQLHSAIVDVAVCLRVYMAIVFNANICAPELIGRGSNKDICEIILPYHFPLYIKRMDSSNQGAKRKPYSESKNQRSIKVKNARLPGQNPFPVSPLALAIMPMSQEIASMTLPQTTGPTTRSRATRNKVTGYLSPTENSRRRGVGKGGKITKTTKRKKNKQRKTSKRHKVI